MNAIQQPPVLGGPGIGSGDGSPVTETDPSQMLEDEFITRSRFAYSSSNTYFQSNIAAQIRKNYSNFLSKHPEGSKYKHESFRARSKTFRPKTRALSRRVEAAVAVAMFATSDLVTVTPWDANDPQKAFQARIKQKLIQYRLDQDETWWFLTVIGAAQDAFINGLCISHQYWKLRKIQDSRYNIYRTDHADGRVDFDVKKDTKEIILENRPCSDLVPIERFRFDPACDWRDPARTSPFLIHECPTYVGEIKDQIRQGIADAVDVSRLDHAFWWAIACEDYDSIRTAREGGRVDKYNERKPIPETQTIAVRKHIHRIDGRDWYWETMADILMLRRPQLLTDVRPDLKEGERPYVTGLMIPEAHKIYPSSAVQLIEPLQEEINDVSNLRQDTVKMATFGRWEVRRNSTVDVATLKAGVPQSVIAVDKVGQDVGELKQRDVPPSAFAETDRLQIDMDEVSGSLTQATASSNKAINTDQTLGGMNLLDGVAGQVRELETRVLTKTWAEPVLQQIHNMLEVYETDEQILGDIASNASVGIPQVLEALKSRTKLRINIGFNATSPEKRIGRLVLACKTFFSIFPDQAQNAAVNEFQKEIFGAVGFDDGERFFPNPEKEDPRIKQLMGQVQQLKQMLQSQMFKEQTKVTIAEIGAMNRERVATITGQIQYDIALMANKIETNKAYLESVDRQIAAEAEDTKRQELQLERVALAHSIDEDHRQFALLMHQAIHQSGQGDDSGANPTKGSGPPPMRTPNGDKAGVLARDDYGSVPFQEG